MLLLDGVNNKGSSTSLLLYHNGIGALDVLGRNLTVKERIGLLKSLLNKTVLTYLEKITKRSRVSPIGLAGIENNVKLTESILLHIYPLVEVVVLLDDGCLSFHKL
jgi:hypothetical protein